MTLPDASTVIRAVTATWPPVASRRLGPFTIRDGAGGGKRASAATHETAATDAEVAEAVAAMVALGQPPLFMVRPGEGVFDAMLKRLGYGVVDPTRLYAGATGALAVPPPRIAAFAHWPPLAIQNRLWAEGGIGPARLAVMERVQGPKRSLLARTDDRPAGTGFVAIHDDIAVIHALEVAPALRRRGSAAHMVAAAAVWAQAEGARNVALAVTEVNAPACALYVKLGLVPVGRYHYRLHG